MGTRWKIKKKMFYPFFIDVLTLTGLKAEGGYLPYTLKGANISKFQSRLVSLWPSFFLRSQSLHLCLTVSFLLPRPARNSLSFILILFHASSFSCSLLIHQHPCLQHPAPPLPVYSLARYTFHFAAAPTHVLNWNRQAVQFNTFKTNQVMRRVDQSCLKRYSINTFSE